MIVILIYKDIIELAPETAVKTEVGVGILKLSIPPSLTNRDYS